MICQPCKNGYHEGCPGATRCPCQHRDRGAPVPVQEYFTEEQVDEANKSIAESIYEEVMGPVVEVTLRGYGFMIQVPEGRDPEEFRRELQASIEAG